MFEVAEELLILVYDGSKPGNAKTEGPTRTAPSPRPTILLHVRLTFKQEIRRFTRGTRILSGSLNGLRQILTLRHQWIRSC